jgi:hypothetical protein
VRRVDALIAERRGRFAQALPRSPQILGKIAGQCGLGGRPAVVRLPLLDPLFAVIALAAGHAVL